MISTVLVNPTSIQLLYTEEPKERNLADKATPGSLYEPIPGLNPERKHQKQTW